MRRLLQRLRDDWDSLDLTGRLAVAFLAVFLWLALWVIPLLVILEP